MECCYLIVIPLAAIFVVEIMYLLKKFYFSGGVCKSKARLDGKTVIITGANTGIGKETALDLVKRGARVILACRDVEKGKRAAQAIQEETKSDQVIVKKLNLASTESIREFADEIHSSERRLDVLLNNAGVMACPEMRTEDGFEMQLGVNHLGHFLLTNLLIDLLKKSSPSRIVSVSSLGHTYGKINFDDLNSEKSYSSWGAYCQSKLANILFTRELARRLEGTGITANCLHPGAVRTDLSRHSTMVGWFAEPFGWFIYKNAVEGAQTNIYCAVAEELDGVSGIYFSDCAPKKPSPEALDDGAAKKLWEVSARMLKLDKTI